jgi:surface protein
MQDMFNCTPFNRNISSWDVSSVTSMKTMFPHSSFNQEISSWDVSNVIDMRYMFTEATSFSQDIGVWDVSNVTQMEYMFKDAVSFNQDISSWCVTNISSEPSEFNLDSPLSESNKPVWGTCPTAGVDDQYLTNISIHPNPTDNTIFI